MYFKILNCIKCGLVYIMSLVLNLVFEEILFIVSYFISIRHKHTAGLHCDIVLRNADMYMKLNKCAKLAWSLGFDLFRIRRVASARIWIVVGLGLG